MAMDRDHFEDGLDRVIAAHGRKVRASIDAAACGTRQDWELAHRTEVAYVEVREAFVEEVFARPPPPPAPKARHPARSTGARRMRKS
jgi:hypothetical protein